jgi:hypothetical protein
VVSRPLEQRAVSEFLATAAVEPAALVLEDDAGIGKTTVWLDATERAREVGFRVLSTRIAETESVPAHADSPAPSTTARGTTGRRFPAASPNSSGPGSTA